MALQQPDFDYTDRLAFYAEWSDPETTFRKKFLLNYFPSDGTVELFDRELNRVYLKRTKADGLTMRDMFVGNTVRLYSRQVKITAFADERTEKIVGKTNQYTFTLIKPTILPKLGEIISEIQDKHDLRIAQLKMVQLNRKEVLDLFEPMKGQSILPFLLDELVSGPVVAAVLVGDDAVCRWLRILGPDDPLEGRRLAPDSMRARYGKDSIVTNGFLASDNAKDVAREIEFFFAETKVRKCPESSAVFSGNSTLCVVKPHAVAEHKLGYIVDAINEAHFKVTAMQMFYLSNANADEFLEVYKGVVSDYHSLLLSFLDGPCVAMEISGRNSEMDVHGEFRRFCGPSDSDIARQIRPYTLRARFGCDKYRNAVHCTDLKEDTMMELEYFFKILKD